MSKRVVVLGGYGVFGGLLARRLAREPTIEVHNAGRDIARAKAHCDVHGGIPTAIDRDGDIAAAFAGLKPDIVIDAAGPFQAYGDDPYRVAKAAITSGAHYLDLADDGSFVSGITILDTQARHAGVVVLSGASSIPAISAAALDELTRGLASVAVVASAILPGNRAPRGLSVVRSIVGQAGRPLKLWRGGRWTTTRAWTDLKRFRLAIGGVPPLADRLGSQIGAPDLTLFPRRYGARSVLFHAGLDLTIMHLGLWLLAVPVRLGLVGSIEALSRPLKAVADRLENFGSDRGGMLVVAIGRDTAGRAVERRWTLIAEAGNGPQIPPTPAFLLAGMLANGQSIEPGARPAIGDLTLTQIEAGLAAFDIRTGRSETPAPPLLERALRDGFAALPIAWKRLANIHDVDCFEGIASVERGTTALARLAARLFGFPPAAASIRVTVEKRKTANGERWTRRFGDKSFVSYLSRKEDDEPGVLHERFGPFTFRLRLRIVGDKVLWPVDSWRLLGIPMPRAIMPESQSSEFVDAEGRFCFDVALSTPFTGPIVRYRGWLAPVNDAAGSL